MIFLPNKYERYIAALRNYLHNLNNKKNNDKNIALRFKKIYEFEALFLNIDKLPCDVKLLSSKVLIHIYSKLIYKNINLDFTVKIKKNYILNIKLFTIVLTMLAVNSKYIKVCESESKIIIKCKTNTKLKNKYLKGLNAYSFYDIRKNILLIVINAQITNKKSVEIKEEWDILNPFSPINLILSE